MAPALPPGPTTPRPLLTLRFLLKPTGFLEDCHQRFGDFFTVRLSSGRTLVITCDTDAIKQVFTGDPDQLHAGEGNAVLAPILGQRSVLVLDGAEHMRQRKLMLPSFHGERMKAYGALMAEIADRHIARWPVGSPFPVHPSMQAITLEVITRAVFGVDADAGGDELRDRLRTVLDAIADRKRLVLLQFTRSEGARRHSPWGRFRALLARADEVVYEQIRRRRDDPALAERDDILSLLLQARDEAGEPLTDRELRDELMTLLMAGHETTATGLAWTLERIVHSPDVLARLLAERDGEGEYLDAVVKEALRLRPVVPAVVRKVTAPLEMKDWVLPEGVYVAPSIYLTHRRPDIYPDPEAFRPERFLGADQPGTYEWIPFGGGIRRCLGASFAQFEMRIVLERILARTELAPEEGPPETVTRRAITFAPSRGGRIRVTRLIQLADQGKEVVLA